MLYLGHDLVIHDVAFFLTASENQDARVIIIAVLELCHAGKLVGDQKTVFRSADLCQLPLRYVIVLIEFSRYCQNGGAVIIGEQQSATDKPAVKYNKIDVKPINREKFVK